LGQFANMDAETHLCSDLEVLRVEVLVWQEEGLLLAERELVDREALLGVRKRSEDADWVKDKGAGSGLAYRRLWEVKRLEIKVTNGHNI
jgi:hypothetical protein